MRNDVEARWDPPTRRTLSMSSSYDFLWHDWHVQLLWEKQHQLVAFTLRPENPL